MCVQGIRFSSTRSRKHSWHLAPPAHKQRSEEHTSELQSQSNLVCRLLLEKKKSHENVISRHRLPTTVSPAPLAPGLTPPPPPPSDYFSTKLIFLFPDLHAHQRSQKSAYIP